MGHTSSSPVSATAIDAAAKLQLEKVRGPTCGKDAARLMWRLAVLVAVS
jgi:hypothetical protein